MSRTAVYTGTFDPPTLGHLNIVARAARLFDRLVIGISTNSSKAPLFTLDERLAIMAREVAPLGDGVEVRRFEGLAVDFATAAGAGAIVRGLRSAADLGFEAPMAGMNQAMAPAIETIFLVATPPLSAIASSLVKDVARGQGDVAKFVTAAVAADIEARISGSSGRG